MNTWTHIIFLAGAVVFSAVVLRNTQVNLRGMSQSFPGMTNTIHSVGQSSTLGWEYCGEYVLLDNLRKTTRAHCVSQESKKFILNDITQVLKRAKGEWHTSIKIRRDRIMEECKRDTSPPRPIRLIRFINEEPEPEDEGKERENRLDRESREKSMNAAKARALGLDDEDLTDIDFAKRLIHYDDFYGSYAIKFDRYDEEVYHFVKNGMTTKNEQTEKEQKMSRVQKLPIGSISWISS